MRLNQYIAHHSSYSRREADKLIQEGRIKVGHIKVDSHYVLKAGDNVFIDGKKLAPKEHFTCIVYHKPKGELVSKSDARGRRVIYESLGEKFRHFRYVGRLDFASEGVLILTDSVSVAKALMESPLERGYILKINAPITQEMIQAMQEGFVCENARRGGHYKSNITSMDFAPFSAYEILKNDAKYSRIKVHITEGKNRELRRFFGAFGAQVLDLRRISYGFVHLNALPVGKKRFFTKDEYKLLRTFLYEQGIHTTSYNKK